MTSVLLAAKYDADKTLHCLESLAATDPTPRRVYVVADDDTALELHIKARTPEALCENTRVLNTGVHSGYWNSLNVALLRISETEPFVYIGNDVEFAPDWLAQAEQAFASKLNNLGLLSFKDDIQDGFNASHGMLTKQWLWVLFGQWHFPREYWHYFCDSELTVRSKDLERYEYCEQSHMPHKHDGNNEKYANPHHVSDYDLKEARHLAWVAGDRDAAQARLQTVLQ